MITYKEIMNKIRQSKTRISRLQDDLLAEQRNHGELLVRLQNHISEETGSPVTIVRGQNATYDRDAVIARIVRLRSVNTSFSAIARILNNDNIKTLHGNAFSPTSVTQLYNTTRKTELGPSLGTVQVAELESAPLTAQAAG